MVEFISEKNQMADGRKERLLCAGPGRAVGGQERTAEERTAGRKTHIPAGGLRGRADSQQIKALRGSSGDWVRKPREGEKLSFLRDLISEIR